MQNMRKARIIFACLFVLGVVVIGSYVAWYKSTYPYGISHCCIILMMGALDQYADDNGGKYPAGQSTSEASLSLLYMSNYVDPGILCGMTVPQKKVMDIVQEGGLLGPDSCGWHYVPGLTQADDPELALLWCKVALGHDGNRTKDGGRQVVFVGRNIEWVSGGKWAAFLEKQKELMSRRSGRALTGNPLVAGFIELPDGSHIEAISGECVMTETHKGPDSSGHGTRSGNGFHRRQLLWYQAPIQNGSVTRTLAFSNLRSAPMTVTFSNGIPDVTNVVFKMR